ncbi:GNAT family N-acetyltransferase [Pseudonocardia sp. HH130630-07]|uniref:GNAT family N-acetyltransferase n=1 Tax=Pseudonocardia sp. HH130630-07 TaxID=1690815 RepID=UPI000839B250|nr:GNAT family N-acetyltransferase [Pseudonocardia sp. HH130630-07]
MTDPRPGPRGPGRPATEVLSTPRLRLEPLTVGHAAEAVALLAAPSLYRFTGGAPPTPGELTDRYRRQGTGHSPDGTERWLNWMVRRVADGRLVGTVQATVTGPEPGRAAIAWVVGEADQGRGYGTEAVTAMRAWLARHGIDDVVAMIRPGHRRSEGLARRVGLRPSATMLDGERMWAARAYPAAMIERIAWATVAVADQDVMREFFVDVLGFEVRADAEMWPGARWLEVVPPGAETGLVLSRASDFGREPDAQYPVGLVARDLAGVVAAARARGLAATEPATESWGTSARITDPEGRELLVRATG